MAGILGRAAHGKEKEKATNLARGSHKLDWPQRGSLSYSTCSGHTSTHMARDKKCLHLLWLAGTTHIRPMAGLGRKRWWVNEEAGGREVSRSPTGTRCCTSRNLGIIIQKHITVTRRRVTDLSGVAAIRVTSTWEDGCHIIGSITPSR